MKLVHTLVGVAIAAASPLAGAANLTTDQRGPGFSRAAASTEGGQAVTDIGAYEYRTDRIFFGDFEAH